MDSKSIQLMSRRRESVLDVCCVTKKNGFVISLFFLTHFTIDFLFFNFVKSEQNKELWVWREINIYIL